MSIGSSAAGTNVAATEYNRGGPIHVSHVPPLITVVFKTDLQN